MRVEDDQSIGADHIVIRQRHGADGSVFGAPGTDSSTISKILLHTLKGSTMAVTESIDIGVGGFRFLHS
jgi:hypothetical protein